MEENLFEVNDNDFKVVKSIVRALSKVPDDMWIRCLDDQIQFMKKDINGEVVNDDEYILFTTRVNGMLSGFL